MSRIEVLHLIKHFFYFVFFMCTRPRSNFLGVVRPLTGLFGLKKVILLLRYMQIALSYNRQVLKNATSIAYVLGDGCPP